MIRIRSILSSAILGLWSAAASLLSAQNANIHLEPVSWANWPALQSYALGEHNGEWLVIGGRTDGLHARQPWASFASTGQPVSVWVLNPQTGGVWSAPVDSVPMAVRDQFKSTNLQFEVFGSWLYLTGGYGLSAATNSHSTHPRITRIHVAQAIAAVKNGGHGLNNTVQTRVDERFAVTGGQMLAWNGRLVLMGGHRFDGAYNPMGHATYVQKYHEKVVSWIPTDSANSFVCSDFQSIEDTVRLHRRDWNVLPFRSDTVEYLLGFSGVFQRGVDLPYTDAVAWNGNAVWTPSGLQQRLNQYHCATFGLYDSTDHRYAAIFLGGIAQHQPTPGGGLTSDPNVPFVSTVGLVGYDSSGWMERPLATTFPGLGGSTAEFMVGSNVPRDRNGLIALNRLPSDSAFLGYVWGGIQSSAPNVFFGNSTAGSLATSNLYKVYWIQGALSHEEQNVRPPLVLWLATQGKNRGSARIQPVSTGPMVLRVFDRSGRVTHESIKERVDLESFTWEFPIKGPCTVLVQQDDRSSTGELLEVD